MPPIQSLRRDLRSGDAASGGDGRASHEGNRDASHCRRHGSRDWVRHEAGNRGCQGAPSSMLLVAVDIAREMLLQAAVRPGYEGVDFCCGDVEGMLPELGGIGPFDLIVSNATVQWFVDPVGTTVVLCGMLAGRWDALPVDLWPGYVRRTQRILSTGRRYTGPRTPESRAATAFRADVATGTEGCRSRCRGYQRARHQLVRGCSGVSSVDSRCRGNERKPE